MATHGDGHLLREPVLRDVQRAKRNGGAHRPTLPSGHRYRDDLANQTAGEHDGQTLGL